jgi:hypothetical protein
MFNQILELEESFSFASYMDVRELRALYYGRLNMYASFTDDESYKTSGSGRPNGIVSHAIDTVVGRKVSTEKFYAKVFRLNKSGGRFIEDIRHYSRDELNDDLEVLGILSTTRTDDVASAIESVMANGRIRRDFDRLWEITKIVSKGDTKKWATLFKELGYIGAEDKTGLGVITKKKVPVMILFNTKNKKDLDIVPVQKYRKDERERVKELVDYKVRIQAPARNRIAKQIVATRGRSQDGVSSAISSILDILKGGNK